MKTILFSLIALTAVYTSQATIRRVNNTPGMNSVYSTITNALNASLAGDTIHVEGSGIVYTGSTINKRIVIIGPGYFLTDTAANPNTQANKQAVYTDFFFGAGSKGSIVQGMCIGTCHVSDSFITLQRNYMYGNIAIANGGNTFGDTLRHNFFASTAGIYHTSTYEARGLFFYNNIFERSNNALITANLTTCSGYFVNNSFATPSSSTLDFSCANFTFQNNIFNKVNFSNLQSSNIFVNNIAKTGLPAGNNNQNNLEATDIYQGWNSPGTASFSSDARYKLKTGSPAINAGILNSAPADCGAFGGPAPYILSGMPPVPSVYQLTMPSQINSGTPAINITVSAAAH